MKRNVVLVFIFIVFFSCVKKSTHFQLQQAYDSLLVDNKTMQVEIDELRNGEQRIINLIRNSYYDKKYIQTYKYLEQLKNKHPESLFIKNISKEFPSLSDNIKQEIEQNEKVKNDSIRLANIDNLGIWEVGYYVDDFGEKTSEAYISTDILGSFSNSATTDSDLKVRFLIDNNSIRIQLYEYARNHTINGEGTIRFKALDAKGIKYDFTSYNSRNGNNTVSEGSFSKVRNLLLKGGMIKFIAISDDGYGTPSKYCFTIENADFLENAYLKIQLNQ